MRRTLFRWNLALRIARRAATRSIGRSLLIAILIALPISTLTGAALVNASGTPTTEEWLDRQLGHAQGELQVVSAPDPNLVQSPTAPIPYGSVGSPKTSIVGERSPGSVLPSGTRVLAIGSSDATVNIPGSSGHSVHLNVISGPSWDPSLAGRYDVQSGRTPRADNEVTLSKGAADRLGVHVGSMLHQTDPSTRTLTVVGIERDRQSDLDSSTLFGTERSFPSTNADGRLDGYAFYLPNTNLNWAQVRALNRQGIVALSRRVALDPPPTPPAVAANTTPVVEQLGSMWLAGLGFLFALIEVGALAAAAFAVGGRTQQRSLAMLAATGGDRSMLVRITTATGIVLGFAGGALGIALGLAGGSVVMAFLDDGGSHRFFGWHLPVLRLILVLAFAVLVGWASATVPARAAANIDVVAALRGARRHVAPSPRGRLIAAAVGLLVGTALLVAGAAQLSTQSRGVDDMTSLAPSALLGIAAIGFGAVLLQIAAVLAAGPLLRLLTVPFRNMSAGPRLGARDVSRNLSRSVPAIAVIAVSVFVATFMISAASGKDHSNGLIYTWSAQPGEAIVNPYEPVRFKNSADDVKHGAPAFSQQGAQTPRAAREFGAALRRTLPIAEITEVDAPNGSDTTIVDPKTGYGTTADGGPRLALSTTAECPRIQVPTNDAACGRFSARGSGRIVVAPATALTAITGTPPNARQTALLNAGGAIALQSNIATRGVARIQWFTTKQYRAVSDTVESNRALAALKPTRTAVLTAETALPSKPLPYSLLITPATAAKLGMSVHPELLLASFTRPPTKSELSRGSDALGAISTAPNGGLIFIEHGPQDDGLLLTWLAAIAAVLIAAAASVTAVGLATADARADRATLEALGAAPRIRRSIAGVQGLLVCGIGCALGIALGLIPAAGLGLASWQYAFWLPLQPLAVLLIALPLVIGGASWLLTGSRDSLGRRLSTS